MKTRINNLEKGQSLVVVTILLIVFLGMLALVLDGGYAYFMRRNAQNAADAGALAAADTWCETENWDLAYDAGKYYAEDLNGADDEESIITSPGERLVRVETNITFDTFFGRILDRDSITAPASATAGCYPPAALSGVLPVAWSCQPPEIDEADEFDSEDCELFWGDDEFPYDGQIYVIMDIAKVEDDLWCQDPVTHEPADYLDCDIDNDGVNDVLRGGQRSWLDLDSDSSNANETTGWISGDDEAFLKTHVWLRASDGGVGAAFIEAKKKEDTDVVIPVFNHYCDLKSEGLPASTRLQDTSCYQDYIGYDVSNDGEIGGDPVWGDNGSLLYDHVISFMVFHITCVSAPPAKYGDCTAKDAAIDAELADENDFTIEGYFVRGYVPNASGGPNNNPWTGAYTVFLID